MGRNSIPLSSRTSTSRSLELPHSHEYNCHQLEPRQIRSFSPTRSKGPTSPTDSSRSRRNPFRLSKLLLTRRRSKSVTMEVASPPKYGERKKNTHSISPTKRRFSVNFLRYPSAFVRNLSKGSKGSTGTAAESSVDEDIGIGQLSSLDSTRVFAVSSPTSKKSTIPNIAPIKEPEDDIPFSCATAILSESYLECCGADTSFEVDEAATNRMPEDPSIQQSFECIFASQLEQGLNVWDEEDEVESITMKDRSSALQSPAQLQQSRLNRSTRRPSKQNRRRRKKSLQYLGGYDPTNTTTTTTAEGERFMLEHCACEYSSLPPLNPESWPQAPLLLRPTPNSGTRVKGVRFAAEKELFWTPGLEKCWSNELGSRFGQRCHDTPTHRCCPKCAILPINNGNEKPGYSLVTDFETDQFEGSLLLRLRFSEGTTLEPYDDDKGYFKGLNRRYQAIVRGRFKKEIPLTELSTGFRFDRPCGKLPPKWILRGGIKVLKFFAPHLDTKLDGERPHSLSPLGSTPQSISVEDGDLDYLDGTREEPRDAKKTLLGDASLAESSLQRAKSRKRNFDKLFIQKSKEEKTDPSKIYTFEFLQHLFDFQEFSIELGSMLGSLKLEEILDGQPLQVMATHDSKVLWSFDVWHKCLWESAVSHDRANHR